jgi:subtilase family serine protease
MSELETRVAIRQPRRVRRGPLAAAAVTSVAVSVAAISLTAFTGVGSPAAAPAAPIHEVLHPAIVGHVLKTTLATPPSSSECIALEQIRCYNPISYAKAYNLAPAVAAGGGAGQTIAIVDSFGSPTIAHDLAVFDSTYNLPAPPSLDVIAPVGAIPPYDNSNSDVEGWAEESTLDVEYAHTFAPKAKILLVETPVSETEGITGIPEIVAAENYVINHNLATVISQSFGATEETFGSPAQLYSQRSAFVNAALHGVTVLAASGDDGAASEELDGTDVYPTAENSWPSSDPLVTSVGGTQLTLNDAGTRLAPDMVWNDGYGAGGGGLSADFGRPAYQNSVASVVGSHRGTPDISMSAAVNGAAVFYFSFDPTAVGYHLVGGTSEATPIFAGVVADAASAAHHRLGLINPALYAIGTGRGGIQDVLIGNNSFAGVAGYQAGRGYDLASGLGTVNVGTFVSTLAHLER